MNAEPIEIPADTDVKVLHQILAHENAEWAQRDPHKAMQIHTSCELGTCIAKSVAWGELVRRGELVPEARAVSGREGGPIGYLHNEDGLTAIGEDGFPVEDDAEPEAEELERYPVIDIDPTTGV